MKKILVLFLLLACGAALAGSPREGVGVELLESTGSVERFHDKKSGVEVLCFFIVDSLGSHEGISCVATGRKW